MDDLQKLLSYARLKKSAGGIITADRFLAPIADCFTAGGELCPVQVYGKSDADKWAKELSQSSSRLTFSGATEFADADAKSYTGDGAAEFLLTRNCVVTTPRKDRDGDILESEGAIFATKVLCWQHNTMLPIGAVWNGLGTKANVTCTLGILDVFGGLGADAAKLVAANALQISHGFNPIKGKFAPLSGGGWHVKGFEIMEVSLVSTPSNVDAAIDLYDAGKLTHALVKAWAKSIRDARQVIGKGFGDGKACSCGNHESTDDKATESKSVVSSSAVRVSVLPGSWEAVQEQLYAVARSKFQLGERDWAWVLATFNGYVIVCVEREGERSYYRIDYGVDDSGTVTISGDPKPVEIEVSVEVVESARKAAAKLWRKSAGPKLAKSAPLYGPLPDSYEDVCEHIRHELDGYLIGSKLMERRRWDCYGYLMGVYDGYAIAAVVNVDRDDNWSAKAYRFAWSNATGTVVLSGEPEAVDLNVSLEITPKAFAALRSKSAGGFDGREIDDRFEALEMGIAQRLDAALNPSLPTWEKAAAQLQAAAIASTTEQRRELIDALKALDAAESKSLRRKAEHDLLTTLGIG
jgi:hypothetical protein